MTYRENYERWLASDRVDEATKAELRALDGFDGEIRERFAKNLEFGTAGLRGVMCAGTNAMNVYTVAHATQGFADLINKVGRAADGVVIACDSRPISPLFAETAACVRAANGVKVKFFTSLRPTPVLSFAVRELKCVAGINITASHNPQTYNGYKAYWEDGAQLPPDHAKTVSGFIEAADIFDDVKRIPFAEGLRSGLIEYVPDELDELYMKNVMAQMVDPAVVAEAGDDLKIVYTPLHGAGYRLVPEVLKRCGFVNIIPVKEQMVPNGYFPTTPYPNPEFPQVFEIGVKLAREVGSDLIVANDPDADRMGIMARDSSGEFRCLTGNQVGALLLDYIVTAYGDRMPENPYAVKTIVTTEIISKICEKHNVKLHNVLTGFKFIGEVIKKYEVTGHDTFLFGFEESYGYLKGTYARDKDSVVATMLLCEMAAYYKTKNMTLCDALDALFETYGYYAEGAANIYMRGLDGLEKMAKLMDELRADPPRELAGHRVVEFRDYVKDIALDVDTGKVTSTGLPVSNVLYFRTDLDDRIIIRPSGTEPKIKIYILCQGKDMDEAKAKVKAYAAVTDTWVD